MTMIGAHFARPSLQDPRLHHRVCEIDRRDSPPRHEDDVGERESKPATDSEYRQRLGRGPFRRTHDECAGFWPGSEIQPFADFINAVPKYVATSTPLDLEWAGSHVIDGGLVDGVRRLKRQPGGDIGVHGSISVTRALLAAGVVDELRLVVAPVVVGSGQRLLDGLSSIRLETIRSVLSAGGNMLVDYRVVR